MRHPIRHSLLSIIVLLMVMPAKAECSIQQEEVWLQKPRVLVSTDIGGTDPDDNQSMVHLMMYSDLFQLEGLISSPSFGNGSKEEILRMIDLYAQDYPKLKQHNDKLMSPDDLRKLCQQQRDRNGSSGRHAKNVASLFGCSYGVLSRMWLRHSTTHPISHRKYASIGLAVLIRNGVLTATPISPRISPISG